MTHELIVLLPSIVLVVSAGLLFLAGRLTKTTRVWGPLCVAALLVAALALFFASARVDIGDPRESASAVVNRDGSGLNGTGLHGSVDAGTKAASPVVLDRLALTFQWMCLGLGLLLALTSMESQRSSRDSSQHFGLLLLMLAGMQLVAAAADLMLLFVSLELVSLPIVVAMFHEHQHFNTNEAALKRFLLNLLSSALVLYGICFIYGLTGTTNLTAIREIFAASYTPADPALAVGSRARLGDVAIVIVLAGLGIRLAAVPFHFAVPETFQGTAAWNAGWLAIAPQATACVATVRLLADTMTGFEQTSELVVLVLAICSMGVGAPLAFVQTNVRSMLAYAGIAQIGFVMMGIAIGCWESAHPEQSLQAGSELPGGIVCGLFHLAGYLFMTAGLFAILVYVSRRDRQIEYVDDLAGLVRREPLAAVSAVVLLLGLAGIPPLPGFWSRWLLLTSTLSVHMEPARGFLPNPNLGFVALGLLMAVCTLVLAAVYLRLAVCLLLEGQRSCPDPAGGQAALAAGIVTALLTVGVGLMPGPLLHAFQQIDPGSRHRRYRSQAAIDVHFGEDQRGQDSLICLQTANDVHSGIGQQNVQPQARIP